MSALSLYLFEVRYQADLLDAAERLDSLTLSESPPEFGRGRGRRRWTRQDRNRFSYECAAQEAFINGHDPLAVLSIRRQGRMTTRVGRLLAKFERRGRLRDLHDKALAEAKAEGTYAIIAPLVARLTRQHDRMLARYRGGDGGDWNAISRRHARAIAELAIYATASPADGSHGGGGRKEPPPEAFDIPVCHQTRPMSLAEAGTLLGLQSEGGSKASRREAAGKAVRRIMDRGGLRYIRLGNKFLFDKRQIPDE